MWVVFWGLCWLYREGRFRGEVEVNGIVICNYVFKFCNRCWEGIGGGGVIIVFNRRFD